MSLKFYSSSQRDLAVMTEEGYCSIVGRIKDMLIRGGENIYPLEIEQIMYEHPQIKDVQVSVSKGDISIFLHTQYI